MLFGLGRQDIDQVQATTIGMFDEVDRQLTQLAHADDVATSAEALPTVTAPPTTPVPDIVQLPPPPADPGKPRTGIAIAAAAVAVLGLALIAAVNILHWFDARGPLTGRAAMDSVVSRILTAESGGHDVKNKRSSASGPAQFLDDTWLEMIHGYRPDLLKGRTREQLLALRNQPHLSREIARRFAERNARLLRRRGLPVTAGTLYLAHFAGAAGASALLEAPPHADAAGVMAMADASGKTSRTQIVKANPFLDDYTVTDIKQWADRKMHGRELVLTALLSADARR
jgi:hypothetical protein